MRSFCIDRYEASMVDKTTGQSLSPYYPPNPKLMRDGYRSWERLRWVTGDPAARAMPLPEISAWQESANFEPKAVSKMGAVPQGYVSYYSAKLACENAGKRLCTQEEWTTACKGAKQTKFPYGDQFDRAPCNVYRFLHPAIVLHGAASNGHLDPRLNLLMIAGDAPVLRLTGESQACASKWGDDAAMDMVGNVDEWVEGKKAPEFRGGFYARATTKGCESEVTNHAPSYYDYSTGARCCWDTK
ncbi:MAG TPA: SUMF1/EgtB/PvdO family nonheme iron enzyme [Polyangiaceae bacterium]|nr:SUMF1/EgtB/PvdO family nonheme iron enzyme [Polyangiaceae bacterium]